MGLDPFKAGFPTAGLLAPDYIRRVAGLTGTPRESTGGVSGSVGDAES